MKSILMFENIQKKTSVLFTPKQKFVLNYVLGGNESISNKSKVGHELKNNFILLILLIITLSIINI